MHMTALVKDKDTPEYALVGIDIFSKRTSGKLQIHGDGHKLIHRR